jgi:LPXTG-motif cell wall-anchored protein
LFIGVVIYFIITKDNDSALFFLGLVILSGLFYILRRKQRIRYTLQVEKNKAAQLEKKK